VEIRKCLWQAECYVSYGWSETFVVPLYVCIFCYAIPGQLIFCQCELNRYRLVCIWTNKSYRNHTEKIDWLKKRERLERLEKGSGWAVPRRCNCVFEWPYRCRSVTRILHTKHKENWVTRGPIPCHRNIHLHFSRHLFANGRKYCVPNTTERPQYRGHLWGISACLVIFVLPLQSIKSFHPISIPLDLTSILFA
jgi:hypothetical protein